MNECEKSPTPEARPAALSVLGNASGGPGASVPEAVEQRLHGPITERIAVESTGSMQANFTSKVPTLSEGFQNAFVAGQPGSSFFGRVNPHENTIEVTVGIAGPRLSFACGIGTSEFQPGIGELQQSRSAPVEQTSEKQEDRKRC